MKESVHVKLYKLPTAKTQSNKDFCDKLISSPSQLRWSRVIGIKIDYLFIDEAPNVFNKNLIQEQAIYFEWHNKGGVVESYL